MFKKIKKIIDLIIKLKIFWHLIDAVAILGVYFNPENPSSIAASLKLLLQDESLRENLGRKALSLSQAFTWERCAQETFSFLSSVYKHHLI